MANPKARFLVVLYDTERRLLLGKGGKFMGAQEFMENPPGEAQDLIPGGVAPTPKPTDPGPHYECINQQIFVCDDTGRCTPVAPPGSC
jgi:hypothetical protein